MFEQLPRKQFTISEYHRMVEAGVLNEDDRLELLEGEIIKMAAIGPRHARCVNRLAAFLFSKLKKTAFLSIQNPIQLDEYSEPEPDIAIVKIRADEYGEGHPTPEDVFIVIEVADTTADTDRRFKLPAYARARIPEAWLIDLSNDRIEVHTQPDNGFYREVRIIPRNQRVISTSLPTIKLKADDILG